MTSALRIPVVGYLVPFNAELAWLEGTTITCRIAYNDEEDSWTMVPKSTLGSIIVFVKGERSVHVRDLRIVSIGKNGQFVNAEMYIDK